MARNISLFLGIVLLLTQVSCVPPEVSQRDSNGKISIDYRDKSVQRIFNFQDARQTDSLVIYFSNPDVTLRYLSALSFASVKDSTVVESLAQLLQDPFEEVRIAAAFALGQLGTMRAERFLMAAFLSTDSLSKHQALNSYILEAIGKCGGLGNLKNLASISTYQSSDTLLLKGQCLGIYRYALRGMTVPEATQKMIQYVADEKIPEQVRTVAANYLARAKDITFDSTQSILMAAGYVRALNPNIRMALAKALGKTKNKPAFAILSKVIQTERDYRVKCNLINAFAKFEYDTVRSLVVPFIFDSNFHVSHTAAAFFLENGQAKDGNYYWRIARDNPNLPWQTSITLYQAGSRWLAGRDEADSKDFIVYKLKDTYQKGGSNPYMRAAALRALGETGWQFRYIAERGLQDPHPAVKTAAAETLSKIANKPNFYNYFGEGARAVRREIYTHLRNAVATGDPGLIAESAAGFQSNILKFNELQDSTRAEALSETLSKLKLPRDLEAYQALEKTIAFFENRPPTPTLKPGFNHPIDWGRLATMPPDAIVTLQTKVGEIAIELLPESAPGSVANFIALMRDGFVDGKVFHRVVPNFVIQGGCPRGDGYGAQNYSIRTEISPLSFDAEGWVGMASAGNDTEGTQFFITHSPTLHLDGNYTIFGRVISGMDAVHKIQQGGLIEKCQFKKSAE